ncbi:MAG: hypothetical protein FWF44_10790, partial [Defluviitaleaceae bacterium]|nr:hypothetical protein [Defluviitaleaceae bacterium]
IWGGPNGKFGDGDDQQVFKDADGTYWVNLGQNIWQQVETPTTLGPLTGGGPNGSPATAKVRPIVNVGNLYYAGPVGKDVDGNDYYYGDSLSNGNGKVDSTASVKDPTDDIFYLVDGQMSITPPAKPVTDTPSVATAGRILTPAQTGDTVNWVEIATNGDYSLIVRASYLNWNSNHKDAPEWQYVSFGATGAYTNSIVRGHINAWFGNTAAGSDVDNLSANAPLRNYTVMSNAKTVLGTDSSDSGGLSNGFSKPDPANPVRKADDVAFALSSCEIANFLSKEYTNGTSGGIAASSQAAIDNFGRITIPSIFGYGMWGRTPGAASNTAGALDNTGRVFRFDISNSANNKGLVYPALWVNSAIFSQ